MKKKAVFEKGGTEANADRKRARASRYAAKIFACEFSVLNFLSLGFLYVLASHYAIGFLDTLVFKAKLYMPD